jgi:drug/metabolite transporter (DMT)-like permease
VASSDRELPRHRIGDRTRDRGAGSRRVRPANGRALHERRPRGRIDPLASGGTRPPTWSSRALLPIPGIGYAVLAAFVWGGYIYGQKRSFEWFAPASLSVVVNAAAVAWYLPMVILTVDPTRVPTVAELDVGGVGVLTAAVLTVAVALVASLRVSSLGEVSYVTPINKPVPVFVLPIEHLLLRTGCR